MMWDAAGNDKLRWILWTGWHGRCPECGEGKMFKSWLKLADPCETCGLDFRFASPDDGPASCRSARSRAGSSRPNM